MDHPMMIIRELDREFRGRDVTPEDPVALHDARFPYSQSEWTTVGVLPAAALVRTVLFEIKMVHEHPVRLARRLITCWRLMEAWLSVNG